METVLKKIKVWNKWHSFALLTASVLSLVFMTILPILCFSLISFAWYLGSNISYLTTFKPFGGFANWVTFFRLGLLFFLAFNFSQYANEVLFAIALVIISMDGLDGFLARKFNQSSDFGGYLDMECDTLLVCLLCTQFYMEDKFGIWILIIANLRYLYVVALHVFKLQHKKEKSTKFAKTIAVFLFLALLTPFIFGVKIYSPIVFTASLLVVYSFGVSFMSLLRD